MPTPVNISASRGAAILGLSKWSTPVQIWLQIMEASKPGFCAKHNYELPVVEDNASMRWGRAFESAIIELANGRQTSSFHNSPVPIMFREKFFEKDFLTCHIDGMYGMGEILHEGKTTSFFYWKDNFGEPGTDRVPIEYQIQCQHQMICTGAEKVILSVLVFPKRPDEWEAMGWEIQNRGDKIWIFNPGEGGKYYEIPPLDWAESLSQMGYFHQYEIPAHPELQSCMIADYTDWWERYVIGETEPEPQSYDDIKALCRAPVGTILADENIENLMAEYKHIKNELSGTGPLAKRADQIKVIVLDYMRSHGAAAIDDDSADKFILRDNAGRKLASYGRTKTGSFYFR